MLAVEPTNGAIALSLGEDAERQADIVGFWRTVEMFCPPSVEKVDRSDRVFAVRPRRLLPWQPGHELAGERLGEHLAWRHVVYVGIYRLDAMFEVLAQAFEPDEESFDERPPGQSALAAFTVGHDGRALLESAVLTPASPNASPSLYENDQYMVVLRSISNKSGGLTAALTSTGPRAQP